jgi:tetratricopeptide (TPR) repeat protein
LHRSALLSFGLLMLMSAAAHADATEDDCLAADPRFSVEACSAALADGTDRSPTEVFRMKAASANALLARGEVDFAMVDFRAAFDEMENGADPGDAQYADVLALYAIAHLRNSDPKAALETLRQADAKDPSNTRLPILKTYAAFAAGDAAGADARLTAFTRLYPNDRSAKELKHLFDAWQLDPAAAVAECQKRTGNGECGAKALALHENDRAAADFVSSLLAPLLRGDVTRMSREEAPSAWSDCEAPEPQYAGPGCDQILAGDITPEERYAASVNRILAFIHNDDAGEGIIEAEHLIARVDYGAAKVPEDDPAAVRAHALLVQAHLAQGYVDEASEAIDAALADQPDDPTYLALRGLIDLAAGNASDADANLSLAASGGDGDINALADVVTEIDGGVADGVAKCRETYPELSCGAAELAVGDEAGAVRKIADEINALLLGDGERPFTLIGIDALP